MYRAINGCLVLEEHSMWHEFGHIFLHLGAPNGLSGCTWRIVKILEQSKFLIAGKRLSLQDGVLLSCNLGLVHGVHLPRDLISVLSSALAALNTRCNVFTSSLLA
ncbi:hypothetical protein MRX96_023437 [Rhipicephalus microplus]